MGFTIYGFRFPTLIRIFNIHVQLEFNRPSCFRAAENVLWRADDCEL